jgi:hypothetical protein
MSISIPKSPVTTTAPWPQLAASLAIAVALAASLLGLNWLHVPAQPAIKAPATTLTFQDLHELTARGVVPTSGLQEAYFAWLGWALAVGVVAIVLATTLTGRRALTGLLAGVSALGLVLTALGVKGVLTWGQFFDQVPNIRAGGYLVGLVYLAALAFSVTSLFRGRRR